MTANRWFRGHSFQAIHQTLDDMSDVSLLSLLVVWSLASSLLTAVVLLIVYYWYMRPRIMGKLVKQD